MGEYIIPNIFTKAYAVFECVCVCKSAETSAANDNHAAQIPN